MYINFNLLKYNKITAQELLTMQAIKQKEYELFEKSLGILESLKTKGYLTTIKGTKKQQEYQKFRLSKKGKNFLRDIQIAEITDDVKKLTSSLISIYESNGLSDRIGNKKKVVELVAWYLSETNTEPEHVIEIVADYITTEENKFVSRLDNLIWKGDNVFSTTWNLNQSKLYQLFKK